MSELSTGAGRNFASQGEIPPNSGVTQTLAPGREGEARLGAGTQLELGQALRDKGIARVECAADDQDRAVIDQAIRVVADRGRPFSANDVRPLLPPGIRPALIGARFLAASKRRQIRKLGWVPSTDPGTHAHPVALWEAA